MVTIKEIASKLGVSPTTVSNVLNGKIQKMSPETRRKIEEALVENHYYRNENKKDGAVPLVVINFNTWHPELYMIDPFTGEVLSYVEKELKKYGRGLIYTSRAEVDEMKRLLNSCSVEGAILVGYSPKYCEEVAKTSRNPIVCIDSENGDYCNIGLQDVEGMKELVAYLIRMGHKKIAFFCDHTYPPVTTNAKRLEGYKQALLEAGLFYSKNDYFNLPEEQHIRHEILRKFAREIKDTGYTAAVFVADLFANEAIGIFESAGVSIPADLSVTGYDDNIYSRLSRPKLTTVRQQPSEKAKEAVRILMQKIKGEDIEIDSMELPTELIVRDSVRILKNNL